MPSTTSSHRPVRPGMPMMPVPEPKPSPPSIDHAWCRRCDVSLWLRKPSVPGFCSDYCYRTAIVQL